ncbi:MAG: transporter, partial [Sporolactobacillus laevolacticus]|nr:transporter [Sporolactobacillus laevolacticus]
MQQEMYESDAIEIFFEGDVPMAEAKTVERAESRRIAGNILKGSLGNMIEWYDWYVYAAFAVYFSTDFFPS